MPNVISIGGIPLILSDSTDPSAIEDFARCYLRKTILKSRI
uniref:RRM domain-containing protein n=1 Tax=Heterorhabditis bacteriophora TaxID=37862 RepID=A0A1I7W9F3_HETBA